MQPDATDGERVEQKQTFADELNFVRWPVISVVSFINNDYRYLLW